MKDNRNAMTSWRFPWCAEWPWGVPWALPLNILSMVTTRATGQPWAHHLVCAWTNPWYGTDRGVSHERHHEHGRFRFTQVAMVGDGHRIKPNG